MNKELQSKLVTDYPDFFAGIGKSPAESCMAFGCECGDGWYDLIRRTCSMVSSVLRNPGYVELLPEHHVDRQVADKYVAPVFEFDQIKEKFGGLRLYYSLTQPVDPQHDKFVQSAVDKRYEYIRGYASGITAYSEYLSELVCEVCGQPGVLYTDGWYSTRCDAHARPKYGVSEDDTVVS